MNYEELVIEKIADLNKKLCEIKKIEEHDEDNGEMVFWEYDQNNSGGSFQINDKVCETVIIEALNVEAANKKAFSLGIYFDGCSLGVDCGCCGDRWYSPYESLSFPYRHGTFSLEEAKKSGCVYEPTTWVRHGNDGPEPDRYDLVFQNIEEYCDYMVNKQYLSFRNMVRIYFADGRIKEVTRA